MGLACEVTRQGKYGRPSELRYNYILLCSAAFASHIASTSYYAAWGRWTKKKGERRLTMRLKTRPRIADTKIALQTWTLHVYCCVHMLHNWIVASKGLLQFCKAPEFDTVLRSLWPLLLASLLETKATYKLLTRFASILWGNVSLKKVLNNRALVFWGRAFFGFDPIGAQQCRLSRQAFPMKRCKECLMVIGSNHPGRFRPNSSTSPYCGCCGFRKSSDVNPGSFSLISSASLPITAACTTSKRLRWCASSFSMTVATLFSVIVRLQ